MHDVPVAIPDRFPCHAEVTATTNEFMIQVDLTACNPPRTIGVIE